MAIAETIAGIKLANEGLKGILDIAKTIKNAELLEKTSTLLGTLIDVQTTVLDLQHENDDLKREVSKLKEAQEFREELYFQDNLYWTQDEADNLLSAYCPTCWDGEKKAMRMLKEHVRGENGPVWHCRKCNTTAYIVDRK